MYSLPFGIQALWPCSTGWQSHAPSWKRRISMDEETRRLVWRLRERQRSSSSLERRLSNRDGRYLGGVSSAAGARPCGQWQATARSRRDLRRWGAHCEPVQMDRPEPGAYRGPGRFECRSDGSGVLVLAGLLARELRHLDPDVIVISSMAAQEQMYDTARQHVDGHVEVVRLYDERRGAKKALQRRCRHERTAR